MSSVAALRLARDRYEQAKGRVAALHHKFSALEKQLGSDVSDLEAGRADLQTRLDAASRIIGKAAPQVPAIAESDITAGDASDRHDSAHGRRVVARGTGIGGWGYWDAGQARASLHRTLSMESGVRGAASRVAYEEREIDAARRDMQEAARTSAASAEIGTKAAIVTLKGAKFVSAAARVAKRYVLSTFSSARSADASEQSAKRAKYGSEIAERAAKHLEAKTQAVLEATVGQADAALSRIRADEVAAMGAARRGYIVGAAAPYQGYAGGFFGTGGGYAAPAALPYGGLPQATYGPAIAQGGVMPVGGMSLGGGGSESPLSEAKELIDKVVVLMQGLDQDLVDAGSDCSKVTSSLQDYSRSMGEYHTRGNVLAARLSGADMGLVEKYAEVQVSSFAARLETSIEDASRQCGSKAMAPLGGATPGFFGGPVQGVAASPLSPYF